MRPAPARRFPPEVLTDAEVRALIGVVPGPAFSRARNRALLAVLYRAGLRLNEALCLRPKDVDPDAGSIRVLFAKGGRARTAGVDAGALAYLAAWAAHRAALAVPPDAPLFCSRSGRGVASAYVRRLLPDLARRAGVSKRVHAHGLRHTHAAQLRAEGVDIGIISKQLGHSSLFTTVLYLDHIAPTAVVRAVRARAWPLTGRPTPGGAGAPG
ncbi:MAG: site-specific integrase [Phycisphaeraceae bacterium]|nr:MAG: site-specific integrase [Phycisphaeraceae bacterium]